MKFEEKSLLNKGSGSEGSEISEFPIGEIDYAIMKSVSYNINTISDLVKVLQIRTIILERHIYRLINEGIINIDPKNIINITQKGIDNIYKFESDNPSKWISINDFILSVIKHKKDQTIKILKIIDVLLLILMIVILSLIIYFVKNLI